VSERLRRSEGSRTAYLARKRRPGVSRPGEESIDLRSRWTAVVRARAVEDRQRRRRGRNARQMLQAQRATLRALEDYAIALTRHGFPVPRRLSREIAVQRSACAAPTGL
jgi:hypothetical protein